MMEEVLVKIRNVSAWYGSTPVLKNIELDIPKNKIYAFIGPSGSGKTTLLRSINRLNDLSSEFRIEGSIEIDGKNVYEKNDRKSVEELRRGIGMVFQQPNPLPTTIIRNMLLPVKEHYRDSHNEMVKLAVMNLKGAGLYDEVSNRLNKTAMKLSGGQQQRLCIARALMLNPGIILFDEPCSALDPISTYNIEELLLQLKEKYTIIIVTHNMEQASRISDNCAFFYQGELIEKGLTAELFIKPRAELTQKYLHGVI